MMIWSSHSLKNFLIVYAAVNADRKMTLFIFFDAVDQKAAVGVSQAETSFEISSRLVSETALLSL